MDPMFPDPVALAIGYYIASADIGALIGDRIGSRIPSNPTYPLIRVTRVGGTRNKSWEDAPRLSVECWGGTELEAANLAYTVVAVTNDMRGQYAGPPRAGRVSGADVVLGPLWSPDETTSRPRYIVDIIMHTHPL